MSNFQRTSTPLNKKAIIVVIVCLLIIMGGILGSLFVQQAQQPTPIAVSIKIGDAPTSSPIPFTTPLPNSTLEPTTTPVTTPMEINFSFDKLCWVAFSPTEFDPNKKILPSDASLVKDLSALKKAGFTGLVTYGGEFPNLPKLAQDVGFSGMLFGVWDPKNKDELQQAINAKQYPIVLGYVIGNEGLDDRYNFEEVSAAMDQVRKATGLPVATTEQIDDYGLQKLIDLGDWVFPNVHPYWHSIKDPQAAVDWTARVYGDLLRRTSKPVFIKEVGLPTQGDTGLSEANQAAYYDSLQKTPVKFVYFESFDGPWKTWAPVEPYWGLFHSDRSPKAVVSTLCQKK